MPSVFSVRLLKAADYPLYRACFSDRHWYEGYRLGSADSSSEEVLRSLCFDRTRLTRLICLRKEEAVGFCHANSVCTSPVQYELSAGLHPNLRHRGLGPIVNAIFLEAIFNSICPESVVARTSPANQASERILAYLGFEKCDHTRPEVNPCGLWWLSRTAFPNANCARLLLRNEHNVAI